MELGKPTNQPRLFHCIQLVLAQREPKKDYFSKLIGLCYLLLCYFKMVYSEYAKILISDTIYQFFEKDGLIILLTFT